MQGQLMPPSYLQTGPDEVRQVCSVVQASTTEGTASNHAAGIVVGSQSKYLHSRVLNKKRILDNTSSSTSEAAGQGQTQSSQGGAHTPDRGASTHTDMTHG